MEKEVFDFYDQTYLKSYNLDKNIRYQLNLLDSLDVFTRKHCENVATITCNLCKKLHCSKGFTEYCVTCAYLHDIGKLFIPKEILQKPGELTAEEYEIMKTHTTLGYQLCMKDLKLRPYHAGAYYHHEALDGTGYPQKLTKEHIPYEAQIIRVADEYDAIVNKRQYKSHVGISDTLKIIIQNTVPTIDPKYGKNSRKIVKKLIKVVLDDIDYEEYCIQDYVKYLEKYMKRYQKIDNYINKMNSAKSEADKLYYKQYAELYLDPDETIDNYKNLYKEYQDAYVLRRNILENLKKEREIVKKLKV